MSDAATAPEVGQKYVATDNAAASEALGLPLVVRPLMFVTVSHVYLDHRKVRVCDGDLWLTFDELEGCFRRV